MDSMGGVREADGCGKGCPEFIPTVGGAWGQENYG